MVFRLNSVIESITFERLIMTNIELASYEMLAYVFSVCQQS